MKYIYLVRHCKAIGQEPRAPLTDEGIQQSKRLAEFFEEMSIQRIYSSPYIRAYDTVKPLSNILNIIINTDERLIERVLSTNELDDWLNKLHETYINIDLKYEGGESSREAMSRGVSVINEILSKAESNVVIVTHGALMSLILRYYNNDFGFEEWKKLSNPDVYRLEFNQIDNKEIKIERIWK